MRRDLEGLPDDAVVVNCADCGCVLLVSCRSLEARHPKNGLTSTLAAVADRLDCGIVAGYRSGRPECRRCHQWEPRERDDFRGRSEGQKRFLKWLDREGERGWR